MRRTLLRLGAVVWSTAVLIVGITATGADANAPVSQGWWTVTNPGGLPANPADAAADVPSDGLLIQAGPVNPTSPCNCTAFAGLIYEIPDDLTATDLTLKVAPNSGTTPVATLELCVLPSPSLKTQQGGPLSDAPNYDCKVHESASLGATDSSFTFHVASLVSDGILAVAVLPGDSTTRVVLSKPDKASLETAASTTSSTGGGFAAPSIAPTPADTGDRVTTTTGGGTTVAGPAPPQLPDQQAVGGGDVEQAPQVASAPTTAAPAPATTPVAAASDADGGSQPVAVVILVAGLGLGAALWAMAGRGGVGGVTEA
jgi:hypothetical protein